MVRDFKFIVKNKIYERCDLVQQNLAEKSVKFLHHSHHCHSYHSKPLLILVLILIPPHLRM